MGYDSRIDLSEMVENKDRKFGANRNYFPVRIIFSDGTTEDGLFTKSQIEVALKRAVKNKEDIPKKLSFWKRLWR